MVAILNGAHLHCDFGSEALSVMTAPDFGNFHKFSENVKNFQKIELDLDQHCL